MINLLLAAADQSSGLAPVNVLRFSEWLSVVVGLVSLAISVIAFFAALMFYLKGQDLQTKAATALAKIENAITSEGEPRGLCHPDGTFFRGRRTGVREQTSDFPLPMARPIE